MEENKTPAWKVSLNFGLITGVVVIIFQLLLYVFDLDTAEDYKILNLLPYAFIIGGMIWASLSYRDLHNNGLSSYGESFKTAFLTGLFASILISIYVVLISSIDESIAREALLRAEEQMYEKNMTDEQINQAMQFTRFVVKPAVSAVMALIVNTILSVIFALVISLFTKREA
ncbi:MAG: DUF4199 domain-containing protein [Bacteroidota bacterium]|nr:DUF4199 domain-containing protein [Bacteroidota bacterium]